MVFFNSEIPDNEPSPVDSNKEDLVSKKIEHHFRDLLIDRILRKQTASIAPEFGEKFEGLLKLYEEYKNLLTTKEELESDVTFLSKKIADLKLFIHNQGKEPDLGITKELEEKEHHLKDVQKLLSFYEKMIEDLKLNPDFKDFEKKLSDAINPLSDSFQKTLETEKAKIKDN